MDNSSESLKPNSSHDTIGSASDFLLSAAYAAAAPLKGAVQLATFGKVNLPFNAPDQHSFLSKAGDVAGSAIDLILLNKAFHRFAPVTDTWAPGLNFAAKGAVYGFLMPSDASGGTLSFFGNKARDTGIAAGTFGVMGSVAPRFGSYFNRSFGGNLAANGLTGLAGGLANVGLTDSFYGVRPHAGQVGDLASYTGLSMLLGSVGYGFDSRNYRANLSHTGGDTIREAFDARVGRPVFPPGEPVMTMPDPRLYKLSPLDPSLGINPPPEAYMAEAATVRAHYGEDSPAFASVLMQLGDAGADLGSHYHQAALDYYNQALRIHETALGPDSLQTAWSYDRLASVKRSMGNYSGAASDLSRAISIWQGLGEANGIDPAYIQRSQQRLAELQRNAAAQQKSG